MNTAFPVFENIWLADDDEDDREIFQDVLSQVLPNAKLTLFKDGEELMARLSSAVRPDILFLDINMPCKGGMDCLLEIRALRPFSRLPIVVFSSTREPKFIDSSYGYGANLFYTKPNTIGELVAGLGNLFRMDWNDPIAITNSHYVNQRFIAFDGLSGNRLSS